VEVLEVVTSCFDGGAVVVKEVGGWKAGWEERVRRVVQVSHGEKGDGVVGSGLVILMLCRVALMGVLQIHFVELDEPIDKRIRVLLM